MSPRVVLDATVALKWVLPETGHEKARELLREYVFGTRLLASPAIIGDEVASGLSKRVRIKALSAKEAQAAFEYFREYQPMLEDSDNLRLSAFALATENNMSYWDALYLALAIEYRCDLVTADARFHRSAVKHYPYVVLLGS